MLQPEPGTPLLRGSDITAHALAARRIRHRMRFVKNDHAIKVPAKPLGDLLDPAHLAHPSLRAQRRIGREQDALTKPDRCALRVAR